MEVTGTGEIQEQTRAGFTITIRPERNTCTVSREGQIESVRGSNGKSNQQDIPAILFIGRRFEMLVPTGDYSLVPIRDGKLLIPYKMWPEKERNHLLIGCSSMSDQFPVWIDYYETTGEYEIEKKKGFYRFAFFDPDVNNYQKMTFKIKNPGISILILKPEFEHKSHEENMVIPEEEGVSSEENFDGPALKSQNPIFQARIYLRSNETAKLKQMMMEYDLSLEDIHIIRAFVKNILESRKNDPKITGQLRILDELLRLHSLITDPDKTLFEQELDKGLNAAVAVDLVPIVEQLRSKAASKEDEIVYWEWEYRLGKITGKGKDA